MKIEGTGRKLPLADCGAGDTSFTAGRLGSLEIKGDNVLLGTPFTFTADNIDKFNF